MKNKIFDKNLYMEGLRQNKVTGIMFSIIAFIITSLIPIGNIVNVRNIERDVSGGVININHISFASACGVLWLLIYLITPFFTSNLFKFMNKRNQSDFYHSIPQTRKCLFLSFYASIVTWIAIIILTTAFSAAAFYPFSISVVLDYSTLLPSIFFFFSASLMVLSAFTIGMSVTGRRISGAVVSLFILFLPTGLYYAFFSAVNLKLDSLLVAGQFGNFFGARMNVPADLISTIGNLYKYGVDSSEVMISCAYTLVLALIYAFAAMILFNRRRSETAGKAAPSQVWQNVFRIVFGFICSVVPLEVIYFSFYLTLENNYSSYSVNAGTLYLISVMYIFVIIGYFLYEIITTGGVKGLKKSVSGLLVLIGLNVAMLGSMIITTESVLNFKPSAEQIKSVSIFQEHDDYYNYENYFALKEKEVNITDDNIKQLVAKSLSDTCDRYHSKGYGYPNYDGYKYCTVKIRKGFRTVYRKLYLPQSIEDLLASNPDYIKMYTEIPEYDKDNMKLTLHDSAFYDSDYTGLSEEGKAAFYNEVREYLASADPKQAARFFERSGDKYLRVEILKGKYKSFFIIPFDKSSDDDFYQANDDIEVTSATPIYAKYAEIFASENKNDISSLKALPELNGYSLGNGRTVKLSLYGTEKEGVFLLNRQFEINRLLAESIEELANQNNTDYSNFLRVSWKDVDSKTHICYFPIAADSLPIYLNNVVFHNVYGYYGRANLRPWNQKKESEKY